MRTDILFIKCRGGNMKQFNDIGIGGQLDRNRIRKLFFIGLSGAILTFAGDWILGYGVCDERLTGLEKKLMQFSALSDTALF